MFPLNKPEIIISKVSEKINDIGELTDQYTKEKIREFFQALVEGMVVLKATSVAPEKVEKYPYDNAYKRPRGGET